MSHTFTHITTLSVRVGPEGGEDDMDVDVRLTLGADLPTNQHLHSMDPDRYDGEVWIERAEVREDGRWVGIPKLDGLWGCAESYVDDHCDELLAEAVEDEEGEAEYAREMAYELRREERA